MNKTIILGIICILGLTTIVSAEDLTISNLYGNINHPVLGGEALIQVKSPLLISENDVIWNTGTSYKYLYISPNWIEQAERIWGEDNHNIQTMNIYGFNSGSIGGGIRAYYNIEDFTSPNNINVMAYGSCVMFPNSLSCVNKDTAYFNMNEEEFTYNGYDVCTSKGNCKTQTKGWSGTCPDNYKLIVKNGLITDCKRK